MKRRNNGHFDFPPAVRRDFYGQTHFKDPARCRHNAPMLRLRTNQVRYIRFRNDQQTHSNVNKLDTTMTAKNSRLLIKKETDRRRLTVCSFHSQSVSFTY